MILGVGQGGKGCPGEQYEERVSVAYLSISQTPEYARSVIESCQGIERHKKKMCKCTTLDETSASIVSRNALRMRRYNLSNDTLEMLVCG